jgi:hypothetical protein
MKFWEGFYWIVTFTCIAGGAAILFFDWQPSTRDVAWMAFFAASIAAHARAKQER